MPTRNQSRWPLQPSITALALDGLAHALDSIVFEYSDERRPELVGVTIAIQVFAAELGHFFSGSSAGRRARRSGCSRPLRLSPTDCVKDRLAAFFHWNDR